MSIAAMEFMNNLMQSMGIPYAFVRWEEAPPDDRYWVGEYIEAESLTLNEDGFQETTFILRGYTSASWLLLEQDKEKIERNASQTAILPNGTGIAVSYHGGSIVPTSHMDWKSMKINLKIQEWKVK